MSTTTFTIGNHYACEIPPEEFASINRGSTIISSQCVVCRLMRISDDKAIIEIPNRSEQFQIPLAWLSEIKKSLPVGIESYLTPDPSRTDLFQHQKGQTRRKVSVADNQMETDH